MPLPLIGIGIGALLGSMLEIVAKLFVKSRFFRLLTSIIMMEALYLVLNNAIQYFIDYLSSRMTSLNIPSGMCWALDTVDLWNLLSFYASVLISFAFAKYFLRMSERLI